MSSVTLMDEVVQASCFEVGRADLTVTRVTRATLGAPQPGEVLFEVERFGFSAAHEWGWPVLEQRYQAALEDFAAGARAWLQIRRHHGLDGAARVYREVLTDASPPAMGHVVEMTLSRPA